MEITTSCPKCNGQFSFDATQAGQFGNCPSCEAEVALTIPKPSPKPRASAQPPRPAAKNKTPIETIRANTCYQSARTMVNLVSWAVVFVAILWLTMPAWTQSSSEMVAAEIGIGLSLLFASAVLREVGSVVFDIADALISQRGKD